MKTGREIAELLRPVPVPRPRLTKTGRRKAQLRNYQEAIARAKLERKEARDALGRAKERAGCLKKERDEAYNDVAILTKKLELATALLDDKHTALYDSIVRAFPKVRSTSFTYRGHQTLDVVKLWNNLSWRIK